MNRRELLLTGAASVPFLSAARVTSALAIAPSPNPHIYWMQASRYSQYISTPKESIDNPRAVGVAIAAYMKQIGHSSVDLGVRRGAHIDPVYAAQRLGPMVEGIRSGGIICDMITTDLVELGTPVPGDIDGQMAKPEDIITAAARAGIKRYRATPVSLAATDTAYGDDVLAQLKAFGVKLKAMEVLNKKLNIATAFHTFSGARFTASIGDFLYAAQGIDPNYIGFNYDTGHMFTEGTSGGWRTDFREAQRYWQSIALKDVGYDEPAPAAAGGGGGRGGRGAAIDPAAAAAAAAAAVQASIARSKPTFVARNVAGPGGGGTSGNAAAGRLAWVKPGTGMVPFKDVFTMLLQGKFNGPVESQDEYNMNGYSMNGTFWPNGLPKEITREQMMANQKQDLDYWKSQAKAAGWTDAQMT